MGEATRSQMTGLMENLQETEAALTRQNINLVDYHSIIRDIRDQELSVEDAAKELQRVFENLETDFSDIEKKISDCPPAISSLGLPSFLCNIPPLTATGGGGGDSDSTQGENKSIYEELIALYSANDRGREYCHAAYNALVQYNFRRTTKLGARSHRRPELAEDTRRWLETNLPILRVQHPALSFFVYDLPAMGTIVKVVVDRVFRLVLILRGVMVEGVNVRGSEENFNLDPRDRALKPLDLWTPSTFEVFRVLTRNFQEAILHFQTPNSPEQSFRNYLHWISSIATLFTAPCRRCGKFLDNGLPCTFRDYRKLEPYHESCRLLAFTPI